MIIHRLTPGSGEPMPPSRIEGGDESYLHSHVFRQVGTLISLFRVWTRARDMHRNPLPEMSAVLAGQDTSPELATACHSLFELTEACIGRRLDSGNMAADDLSSDELALLALVEAAPKAGTLLTEARVPHGLPGALQWAASAVLRAIGGPLDISFTLGGCPFARTDPQF
jgi:hypothetical protein